MCGFGGILNSSNLINSSRVAGIADQVSFRGPDNCRLRIYNESFESATVGNHFIFFNRLAIIDLDSRSDQPFEDDRFTLMFNGEIYNFHQLKKELGQAGFVFKTSSDTEVLFYAMQKWGVQALKRLNGMFSLCWIDRQSKSFILARDRMGIKPLCYRQQGKSLIFASELISVLRLSETLPGLEHDSIEHFLWTQYVPTPLTIVQGVYKIPPGHYFEGNLGELERGKSIETKSFWDAFDQVGDKNFTPEYSNLEEALRDSLSRQLVADVPLGLFLSSGVDSSLIAAMINKYFAKEQEFNFFTVAFDEDTASDESQDAIQYIRSFRNPRLKSHLLEINPDMIGDRLVNLYDYFDEPFGDPAALLNWAISCRAREHVTVALSGDGADELFWGYPRYNKWMTPSLTLKNQLDISGAAASLIKPFLPGPYLKSKADLELEPDPLHRHFTLFLSPVLHHVLKRPPWSQDIWAMQNLTGIIKRRDLPGLLDIKTYLSDAMLYKVDRASMAASLEVRVPYLDNVVVDYALAASLESKSDKAFRNKSSLKKLLKHLAPQYDVRRTKKGFNFPLDKWMRFKWKDLILSMITKENLASLNLHERNYLSMTKDYYAGDKRYCIVVWYILNLILWNRAFKTIPPLHSR
jgi:asparagine synthase (glutamine-hydrolysing)